jgi:hypothetical protein
MVSDDLIDKEAAIERVRAFVHDDPLLKPLELTFAPGAGPEDGADLLPGKLQLVCTNEACGAGGEVTTWKREYGKGSSIGNTKWIVYSCAHCEDALRVYWLFIADGEREPSGEHAEHPRHPGAPRVPKAPISRTTMTKLGQVPYWSAPLPKRLVKSLGKESKELLQKGLACIGQSYGIGACAYLRRLVEHETDAILAVVEAVAEAEGDQATLANLTAARAEKTAKAKLETASKHVPKTLKPGGQEPLKVLYDFLSPPLHSTSEKESLAQATEVLGTISFLFATLKEKVEESKKYAADLAKMAKSKN